MDTKLKYMYNERNLNYKKRRQLNETHVLINLESTDVNYKLRDPKTYTKYFSKYGKIYK